MRWLIVEYMLKGAYLGLLTCVVLQDPSWAAAERVAWCTLAGLAVCLGFAAVGKMREGYRPAGKLGAFFLFLALESPTMVYAGILIGAAVGVALAHPADQELWLAPATVGGGALVGLLFLALRFLKNRWARSIVSFLLVVLPLMVPFWWLSEHPDFLHNRQPVGVQMLIGMVFFYLLTFAGRAEETEVEIGVVCAGLALGIWLLDLTPRMLTIAVVPPLILYFLYTTRVLPGLRVFKLAMRGHSYAGLGRHRQALQAFRRALELQPDHRMAREGLWAVHRRLNLSQLANDPETMALVNVDLCLQRATSLLLETKPSADRLDESLKLLAFILTQRPGLLPIVDYWKAVAHTHAGQFEQAADSLTAVLESTDPNREAVLVSAWQLALMLHPEMQRRVGTLQMAKPGQRLAAIAAVERKLAVEPEDPTAWDLKRLLYTQVTEADYNAAVGPDKAAADFDHAYVEQLGTALVTDPTRWQRGAEYLRMAVRGLPTHGPSAFVRIAQAHLQANDNDGAHTYYQLAQKAGRAVGAQQLSGDDRKAYLLTIKYLGDTARLKSDWPAAIESYQALAEADSGGIETYRTLADLFEKKGDPLPAARAVEQALIYNSSDKDLLERKDRYYYSIAPDDLRARLDSFRKGFDVAYCVKKARSLLDTKNVDTDMVDWASHLVELAHVLDPQSISTNVLRARAMLRRGDRDRALVILEDLKCARPESFPTSDDQDSWYVANRLLGDLYLDELGRPDLAVDCYTEFRKSSRSGADTIFKLAQALERSGETARALKCYEQVTAYDKHPLAPEARQAVYRLKAG
jgi:tetratricopeptide (TPR) repeat protein